MEKLIIAVIAIIILAVLIYFVKTRNYFKTQKEEIENWRSKIEIALTQRYDTLIKLNATVKGYAGHEFNALDNVTKLRKGMTGEELSKVSNEMDLAQSRINALAENYPDLKASFNFLQMQETIVDLELTLQATRRKYNEEVKEYNSSVVAFPSNIIANATHTTKESYFEAEEHKKQDYEVKF